MKNTQKQPTSVVSLGKQRSYNEIVEFLDKNWETNKNDKSLSVIKKLDKAFGSLSTKLHTVLVGGTNGKSLTISYATKLLKAEGLKVGSFCTPHILTYNERLNINDETIANKTFTEIANEVINTAETLDVKAGSTELLTMMSLVYFSRNDVDVALMEVCCGGMYNPVNICSPKVSVITRVTDYDTPEADEKTTALIKEMLGTVRKDTHVVSADQSKAHLTLMQQITEEIGGHWGMPIRKLAPLNYPFEQLHGRCAALAERLAYIYVNNFANKDAVIVSGSLLTKTQGRRGRPTLEAKRQSELNPKKTLEQFWKEVSNTLPGRFHLLDKEKPTLLLDNAQNLDAFKNLLLGIRLLHYHRPLKGLTLLIGCNNNAMDMTEFLKLLRYFFKKTSGQVILCPANPLPGHKGDESWDVEKITNATKSMKIKARAFHTFREAFEAACNSVDERHGLVVIAGSPSIVSEYWKHKGIKKF